MIHAGQLLLVPPNVDKLPTGLHRVVLVLRAEKVVALHCMQGNSAAKPRTFGLTTIVEALSRKRIETVPEPERPGPSNAYRAAAIESKTFKRNKAILEELSEADRLSLMLCYGHWGSECEKAGKSHSIEATTVARLLCRYFRLNLSVEDAALGDRWTCGRSASRTSGVKLGRRAKRVAAGHRAEAGRNTTEDDKASISTFYGALKDQSISQAEMWRQYEQQHRPKRLEMSPTGRVHIVGDAVQPFITKSQFVYHLKKAVGDLTLLTDAAGERRVNLSHRPALGSARDRIPYPGHTYILDATIADVYLVSAFDRRLLIGRPVIYVVIDAFSSLIVGLHVALEGPSFDEARVAMYRAISAKTQWLTWLGLPDLGHLLPQGCKPAVWLCDRGEMHSKASYKVAFDVNAILSLAAAYRADWKSLVERNFGTINTGVIHWLPGAVNPRAKERGDRDKRLDATLTLKEFTRVLVRMAALLNLTRDMSRHLSASLMRAGQAANPISFWAWGLKYLHGSPHFLDQTAALRATLRQQEAKLSRHGAFGERFRYTADWMQDHPAVRLAGFQGSLPIQLIASPDDPSKAFCLLPDEGGAREASLHSTFSCELDYGMEDVIELQELRSFAGRDLADDTADMRVELNRANSQEVKEATAATRAAHKAAPMSKSERTKGIATNRRAELEAQKAAEVAIAAAKGRANYSAPTGELSAPGTAPSSSPAPDSETEQGDFYARMNAKLNSWGKKP